MDILDDFTLNDFNVYDDLMAKIREEIYTLLNHKYGNSFFPFYLIGISKENEKVLNHEISHGLYYLNPSYKKEMDKLVSKLPPAKRNLFRRVLMRSWGYPAKVVRDEMQAYLATGFFRGMKQIRFSKRTVNEFKKVFKRYAQH